MEKRTIVAFVLSFLVLILWSYVFRPDPQPVPPPQEGIEEKTPAAPVESPVQPEPQAPRIAAEPPGQEPVLPPAAGSQKEQDIVIETPLYHAVLSTAGPTIKSFSLKAYREAPDPESPMVELVHVNSPGNGLIRLALEDPAGGTRPTPIYHTDLDTLTLNEDSAPRDITFTTATDDGIQITQAFRIYPDRYPIDVSVSLKNTRQEPINAVLSAHLTNRPPEKDRGYYTFMGLALLLDGKIKEIKAKKLDENPSFSGRVEWIAYEDGHFMTALIPGNQEGGSFSGRITPSGVLHGIHHTPPLDLLPQSPVPLDYTLYLGPRDLSILKSLGKNLDLAINFGWTNVIAKPLLYALRFFNDYVKNYGLAIIILTVLIKILFWPLTHKSYKSMKEMKKIQPHMARLREKYKNNKEQLNKEMMSLYRTYKVNPMGGCLPMVIQIPVFFALYRILGSSIELRHAPFFFWINDLSAPDRLFNFPFSIPFMAPPYGIPVLTLFMGASMFIQQKMTPTPGDPSQAKIMMLMPIIFTVMFINFPSGLVLYWLTNNILSIGQQYRIIKSAA